jgi:5-(carboxyamino)imidazole ribonucleotide synthase
MRIGIIGAGQLGQMLGFAASELGDSCCFIDPSAAPPAAIVGPVIEAAFDDATALATLARQCDVITYEFENVPVEALSGIASTVPVYPPIPALQNAQDRLAEKQLFETLRIPLPAYRKIDSARDLEAAAASIGLPLVVKTRRMGYDGKGQAVLRDRQQIASVMQQLGQSGLIAEQWIAFDYEVSAIGARGINGDVITYALTQNEHADGILRQSRAPIVAPTLTALADTFMRRLLKHLDYVGILALELFVVGEKLLANEFAPRVHNSGHWTIEGASPSQFTSHLRAITNRPLLEPVLLGHAGMLNLIGTIPDEFRALASGHLHDYGKAPRPGRKLGHITVVAATAAERDRKLAALAAIVTGSTHAAGTAP